ncbi:MAG: RNA polymerase subunit sigma-70 [Candidatus Nanopelagicales bacterium]
MSESTATREDADVVAAAQAGDEAAFTTLVERYRRELQLHCYRMLGSFEDSEDLAQETFLRAWHRRETYQSRSTFRAWLYRIATNACLDALETRKRRVLATEVGRPVGPDSPFDNTLHHEIPWLQPYPDRLLPDAVAEARETVELAFLAAIQHLPPKQRAALILRDVLGWSANETAALLDTTVASANSALQRGRDTLRERLPRRRDDWKPTTEPTAEELRVLQRYLDAHNNDDPSAIAQVLSDDCRLSMPPTISWFDGRGAIVELMLEAFDRSSPGYMGQLHVVPTSVNRQLAAANYLRKPGSDVFEALALDVLTIEGDKVVEVVTFDGWVWFPRCGIPVTLPTR